MKPQCTSVSCNCQNPFLTAVNVWSRSHSISERSHMTDGDHCFFFFFWPVLHWSSLWGSFTLALSIYSESAGIPALEDKWVSEIVCDFPGGDLGEITGESRYFLISAVCYELFVTLSIVPKWWEMGRYRVSVMHQHELTMSCAQAISSIMLQSVWRVW